jgi:hypothetical protein
MAMLAFVGANLFAIGKVAYRELIRSYILLKAVIAVGKRDKLKVYDTAKSGL